MTLAAQLGWWGVSNVPISNLLLLDDTQASGTASSITSGSLSPAQSDILFVISTARDDASVSWNAPSTTLANATFTEIGHDQGNNATPIYMAMKVWRVTFSGAPGTGTISSGTGGSTFQRGLTTCRATDFDAASPIGQVATNNKATGTSITTTFGGAPASDSLICSAHSENTNDGSVTEPSGHVNPILVDVAQGSNMQRHVSFKNTGGTATALTWSNVNNNVGVAVSWEVKN